MAVPKSILVGLGFLFGIFLVGSGIAGMVQPLYFAREVFRVPTATEETVVFYPGLAGRNISAGIAVFAFIFTGQRKALGTFLFCWTFTGIADCYVLLIHPYGENLGTHIFNIVWISSTGLALMLS